jgi:hypothetical protein
MTIRFQIPELLLPKLKQLQKDSTYMDEMLKSEDAIVMTLGLGPAMYLTMDYSAPQFQDQNRSN